MLVQCLSLIITFKRETTIIHSLIQQIYDEHLQYAGSGDRTINKASEPRPRRRKGHGGRRSDNGSDPYTRKLAAGHEHTEEKQDPPGGRAFSEEKVREAGGLQEGHTVAETAPRTPVSREAKAWVMAITQRGEREEGSRKTS